MNVKIENAKLGQVIDLLFNLSLKGKQSRHRTKFIKTLSDRLQEVTEQEKELLKEHCHLDEEGNPKTKNDGQNWDVKDIDAFIADKTELYEEELVIDGGDAHGMLKTVQKVLDECEVAFSGQEAVLYDYLCEQFEGDDE
ncbi:DUF1617 family protein [Lederbergia lenta]|uniref:DUF1617 family protein n=1 Tax=Lederbergia lenta TaxID=1467 RepID=UPI00203F282C|nr:DUF1617 family protein [Lederbergia lenta]MCM3110053.1 DUF1617 family protein [Lederbergia lenta]